jgi:hypothetical protein
MAAGDIKILDKLYVNQNLICLIVSFVFILYSKELKDTSYCWLHVFNGVFFLGSLLSVLHSLYYYTVEYKKKKEFKEESYELRLRVRRKVANNWTYEQYREDIKDKSKKETLSEIDSVFKV